MAVIVSVVPSVQASPPPEPLPLSPESPPLSSPQAANDAIMAPALTAARMPLVRFTLLPLQVSVVMDDRARPVAVRQRNPDDPAWPRTSGPWKVAKLQRFEPSVRRPRTVVVRAGRPGPATP